MRLSPNRTFAVSRLTLTDFRNYGGLRATPAQRVVVLTGANGAGKTNLLEAISLLTPGRGLRGEEFSALARRGEPRWAVSADIETVHGAMQVGTAWQAPHSEEADTTPSRSFMVDGVPAKSASALAGHLRLLWVTPAMDRLFTGSPGERRRFFDRLVALFDPEQSTRVNKFEKLVRERNRVLQEPREDGVWLNSLETQMAEAGVAIAAARAHAIAQIAGYFGRDNEGPFPWGRVTALGEVELLTGHLPAMQAEESYRRTLQDTRAIDRAAGRCLRGPHRSDFEVVHGPKDMPAEHCSTGEQKALLLGLVLAQAEAGRSLLGAPPVLLLDEAVAHLDSERRLGLFSRLHDLGGQAWLSGTDGILFNGIGPQAVVYRVENGQLFESEIPP